ncbi:uncharacterized protein LAJ45_03589 [Morchella importuna]|uniref:uncharacterized protein n=1 Tax=Morchella importuna TaxID=1174673 RepID=UPI001E8DD611|nr:uncharacterized protein LAJ45_03589 [Morchella importuna]KAH8152163.1 hypothetical protein LAJ45_03589 [Morchella importuna]
MSTQGEITGSDPAWTENPFDNIPVEIIKLVADSAEGPEHNAALGLCSQDLESILSTKFTKPEATVYVAVCSFERNLILRVIWKNGRGSMIRGLTHEAYDCQYALDIVADANLAFRNQNVTEMLLPILNGMAVDALPYTCLYANTNPEISAALLPYIPDHLRADACTSEVENAVTSGKVGVL